MKAYIVRILPHHDFYVPFTTSMCAGDVKHEMFMQLNQPTKNMTLIYNGKVMEDHVNLETVGAKHSSVLFMVVKNFDTLLLHDPKSLVLEICSLISFINNIPYDVYNKAVREIKSYLNQRSLQALGKISKDIREFFANVENILNDIESPFDPSMLDLYFRLQDNEFNMAESEDGEIYSLSTASSNTIELVLVDNTIDEVVIDEEEPEENDQPLNISYKPSINSEPLPLWETPDETYDMPRTDSEFYKGFF